MVFRVSFVCSLPAWQALQKKMHFQDQEFRSHGIIPEKEPEFHRNPGSKVFGRTQNYCFAWKRIDCIR